MSITGIGVRPADARQLPDEVRRERRADDECRAIGHGRHDVGERTAHRVGLPAAVPVVGADRDDDHVRRRGCALQVIRELQGALRHTVADQLREPRLVERDAPLAQHPEPPRIGIDAEHLVAPFG